MSSLETAAIEAFKRYTTPQNFPLGCTSESISRFCFKMIIMELFGFKPSKSTIEQFFPGQLLFTLDDVTLWIDQTTSLNDFDERLMSRMTAACGTTSAITLDDFKAILRDVRGDDGNADVLFRYLDGDKDGVLGVADLGRVPAIMYQKQLPLDESGESNGVAEGE